jgi:hypothetical protein
VGFLQAGLDFVEQTHGTVALGAGLAGEKVTRRSAARTSAVSFAESIDMVVVQPERADERLAFGEAVTVGAACDQESQLAGESQIMVGMGGGMFRVKTFESVEAGLDKTGNGGIHTIQTRVRQDCQAAGGVDQVDALERQHFEFGDPGGAILFQEPIEGFVDAAAETAADQGTAHMRSSGGATVGECEDVLCPERNAQPVEALHHFADPALSNLLEPGCFAKESWMIRLEVVSEQVNLRAVDLGGEFGAGDELDTQLAAGEVCAGTTFDRIVISKRDGVEAEAGGVGGQFLG